MVEKTQVIRFHTKPDHVVKIETPKKASSGQHSTGHHAHLSANMVAPAIALTFVATASRVLSRDNGPMGIDDAVGALADFPGATVTSQEFLKQLPLIAGELKSARGETALVVKQFRTMIASDLQPVLHFHVKRPHGPPKKLAL